MVGSLRQGAMGIAQRLGASLRTARALPRPYQLQLHLTDYCNLRCVFCPTKTFVPDESLDAKNELTTQQWLDLIDQAAQLGVEEFHICGGGEPFFFHNKAMAVMARIKQLEKRGETITNGAMLKPELILMLVENGWDKMTFSVDGPDAGVHDRIRGGESFRRITDTIREFTRVKEKLITDRPQLCIHFVVCALNYRTIPEMVPLCESLGIETFLIQALNIWSEDIAQYQLSEEQEEKLQTILKKAHREAERAGLSTNIQDFLRHDLFSKANTMDKAMADTSPDSSPGRGFLAVPCYMPWYNLSVFADGRTLPCFILRDSGVSFKEHSLQDIWESGYFQQLRERMLTNCLGTDCARCNPWSLTKTEEIRNQLRSTPAASSRAGSRP